MAARGWCFSDASHVQIGPAGFSAIAAAHVANTGDEASHPNWMTDGTSLAVDSCVPRFQSAYWTVTLTCVETVVAGVPVVDVPVTVNVEVPLGVPV